MSEGLGLRYVKDSSDAEIAKAKPIANEVMVTLDEGRVLTSQVGMENAKGVMRSLPFTDEVFLLDSGSEVGLSALASEQRVTVADDSAASKLGRSCVISEDGTMAIFGMPQAGSAGSNEGALAAMKMEGGTFVFDKYLTPDTIANNDLLGGLVVANADLSVVVATKAGAKAVTVFKDGAELITLTHPNNPYEAIALSSDSTWLVLGVPARNNSKGEIRVFKYNGTTYVASQTLAPAGLSDGDKFGQSLSLGVTAGDLILAVGAPGSNSGAGNVQLHAHNGTDFILTQAFTYGGLVAGECFGDGVVLSSDAERLYVGAPKRAYTDTELLAEVGAVYVGERQINGLYSDLAMIQESGVGEYAQMGSELALSGDNKILMIGASKSALTGANAGAVVAIDANQEHTTLNIFQSIDAAGGDLFGCSLSLSQYGDIALIGAYGAGGYEGYVSAMASSSKWRKALPEVSEADITAGSSAQGTISGKTILKAIQDRVSASYVVTGADIEEGKAEAGFVSGRTLRLELDKIQVIAGGANANAEAPGFRDANVYAPAFAGAIDGDGMTISVDLDSNPAQELEMESDFPGDWSIEVRPGRTGATAILVVHQLTFDGVAIGDEIGSLEVRTTHSGPVDTPVNKLSLASTPYIAENTFDGQLWMDLNDAESIILALKWKSDSEIELTVLRSDGRYEQRTLALPGAVIERTAKLKILMSNDEV